MPLLSSLIELHDVYEEAKLHYPVFLITIAMRICVVVVVIIIIFSLPYPHRPRTLFNEKKYHYKRLVKLEFGTVSN